MACFTGAKLANPYDKREEISTKDCCDEADNKCRTPLDANTVSQTVASSLEVPTFNTSAALSSNGDSAFVWLLIAHPQVKK